MQTLLIEVVVIIIIVVVIDIVIDASDHRPGFVLVAIKFIIVFKSLKRHYISFRKILVFIEIILVQSDGENKQLDVMKNSYSCSTDYEVLMPI